MDTGDIKFYVKRWQEVSKVELEELRASTVPQNWKRLMVIRQRAKRLGLSRDSDNQEMEVFLRWAKLKKILCLKPAP